MWLIHEYNELQVKFDPDGISMSRDAKNIEAVSKVICLPNYVAHIASDRSILVIYLLIE